MDDVRRLVSAFDPALPLERGRTIPAAWYLDSLIHALERSAVFGDTWQFAGRADLVAAPGAFLTMEIAGRPILIVRDGEGVLRAFYNVCRHRAAPVVCEPAGQASRLRCPYHGWTYDLAGRLRGVPEFDGVAEFCREDHGLIPLAVAEWGRWVWIHAGQQPTPLVDDLTPLPESVGSQLSGLHFVARREYEVGCNWKVFVDNYLDGGYHVNTIHPGLAGVLDYPRYRTEIHARTSVQLSPLKSSDSAVADVRTGSLAQYWWIFPNLMLNIYEGVLDTNLVLPVAPDRCRVLFDFWFAETAGSAAEHAMKRSMEVAHQIQEEDVSICERVQRGLSSGCFDTGRFSVRREAGGYHFHQLLANHLRAGSGAAPTM